MNVGDLVVVKTEEEAGVGRVESITQDLVRIFFYASGTFAVYPRARVLPCPENAAVAGAQKR